MNIAFLLPANFALDGPGNGVRVQAWRQAAALRDLGHDVTLLEAWRTYDLDAFDVIQFFMGGPGAQGIERAPADLRQRLVWAPMIDSNESNSRYRAAAWLGQLSTKVFTIPGEFRKQAMASRLVVCRSTHERERVVRGLGVEARRTAIVLNGVTPPAPVSAVAVEQLCRELALTDRGFVLHVSSYTQPRKNVLRLIDAVGSIGLPLVIAGTAVPGPALDTIRQAAKRYAPTVRLLGYLDQARLDVLYASCRVFALPSEHEGTGLVALEAAAHGANVVITRNGGPRDYFNAMAEYVDPRSAAGIAAAIRRAWDRPRDEALRSHVLANLTWAKSAASLIEAYDSAVPPARLRLASSS